MQHTGGCVERLALLEEPQREIRGERAHGHRGAGSHRAADPSEHVRLVAAAEQPEPALTEADGRVELGVVRQRPDVENVEHRG